MAHIAYVPCPTGCGIASPHHHYDARFNINWSFADNGPTKSTSVEDVLTDADRERLDRAHEDVDDDTDEDPADNDDA